ncbi:MAG: hypothetical protein ACO1N7_07815 [Sphingobacteriaceae bacterium]
MNYPKRKSVNTPIPTIILVMVVIVVAILFLFSIPQTYFHPSYIKLRNKCENCEKAKTVAIDDFKKGNYQVVAWGLISSESPTIKIAEILEKDYKIKTVFGGCIAQDAIECYDTQMRRLLASKLGDTFYKNAYEQAKNSQ